LTRRPWLGALPTLFLVAMCRASGDGAPSATGELPAPGTLTVIGTMSTARAAHTATVLLNGSALIVGGLDAAGSTAELFDPQPRAFSRTGALRAARAGHSATMLADGRVLIAGGYNGEYLSSSEVYDPARGEFVAGPPMLEPRSSHLAIALKDGRVLFVGGTTTGYRFMSSAELFDPAANRFVATGAMSVPRESHVGALLPDGSVLIAGGHTGRRENIQLYASAERYHPARGVFSPTGSMTRRRHKHAAIGLSDGRVLITGGADERDDQGQYRDAEVYDASTGRFSGIGAMQRSRYKHEGSMVLLRDGSVLLAGGSGSAELFDPRRNAFDLIPASASLAGSFSAVATLPNGSVLITGGYGNGTGARASAWLFTPR